MNKLLLLLPILFMTGCATKPTITPVSGESLRSIKTEKVAVKYTLATKRINYVETVYRVLWLETNTSSLNFSGIWSPDQDITGYVVSRMRQQGIRAESVYDVVNPSLVDSANRHLAQAIEHSAGDNPAIKGSKLIPKPTYFSSMPIDAEFSALSEALRSGGIRYLIELTAMDVNSDAPGYGLVTVHASPNVRVINLQTNKVIWTEQLFHHEPYQLGGDFKKLEENSISKTKEGLRAGINKIDFLSLWEIQ